MTSTTGNSSHPHRVPPPYRHYAPSSSASFKSCCCCLFLLLIFVALLAVAVALVLVLALKPKPPDFHLQQVGVSYLLVNLPPSASSSPSPSPSAAYLSMNISLIFATANPNKVAIRYQSPGFVVMYKGVPLGTASFPPFEVPAHGSRVVETTVVVERVDVLRTDALQLVRDATVYDRVEFRVVGDVGARIRLLTFTSPKVQVTVDCAVVVSPSKQSVTSTQCGVDGLSV